MPELPVRCFEVQAKIKTRCSMHEQNPNRNEVVPRASLSHSFSIHVQESDTAADSTENCSQSEQVRELEAEVDALRRLVCHLLEKNERLRMRLQWFGGKL